MERLRDAAMKSDYAYDELRHLTDNIGPTVERVAAGAEGGGLCCGGDAGAGCGQ